MSDLPKQVIQNKLRAEDKIYKWLDNQSQKDWTLPPTDRSLCPEKCKTYLNSTKIIVDSVNVVQVILENTRYITFQELYDKLRECIMIFLKIYRQFNVYFPIKGKIGSEHWLTVLMWKYIREGCMGVVVDHNSITLNNGLPVLIIDDCAYSGISTCDRIDDLQYNYNSVHNKIVTVLPYYGTDSLYQARNFPHTDFVLGESLVPYTQLPQLSNIDPRKLCLYTKTETTCAIPVYFDHKIANNFGSFPKIYSKVIKVPFSRSRIEELEEIIKSDCNLSYLLN